MIDCTLVAQPASRAQVVSNMIETISVVLGYSAADSCATAADNAYGRGDFDLAVACYSKAIAIAPHEPTHFAGRAAAYVAMGRYGDAIADYGRAIRSDPKYAPFYYERAQAHLAVGAGDRARKDIDVANRIVEREITARSPEYGLTGPAR